MFKPTSSVTTSQILMKYRDALAMIQHYSDIANEALKELQSLSPDNAIFDVPRHSSDRKNSSQFPASPPELNVQIQRFNTSSVNFVLPPQSQITFNESLVNSPRINRRAIPQSGVVRQRPEIKRHDITGRKC